ncbi:MAG: hypothetical protein CMP10_02410 [Zetaproteobacteria bacterium]|nr:hypothetical protein [Pseudobdellovibrionaceae bacterium]
METAFYLFCVFLGLLASQELVRRFPRIMTPIFWILPIALYSRWQEVYPEFDLFLFVKIWSLVIGITWTTLFRTTPLGEKGWFKYVVYAILVINILEAVMRDLIQGNDGIANYFNGFAGILLVVTLHKYQSIHTKSINNVQDMYWGSMTRKWVIGYTIWNFTFVYLNYNYAALNHIAVLSAPLFIAMLPNRTGEWLQDRFTSLAIYLLYNFTFRPFTQQFEINSENTTAGLVLSTISISFLIFVTFMHFKQKSSTDDSNDDNDQNQGMQDTETKASA